MIRDRISVTGQCLVIAIIVAGCASAANPFPSNPPTTALSSPAATGASPSIASATSPSSVLRGPSGSALPAMSYPLSISNGTTIAVRLVVNGADVETIPPGGYADPVTAVLPALPWSIEVRSPSGRVLSRMTVNAGDVVYTTPDASGASSANGRAVRVDLPCGRLDVWSGPPMLGPTFIPNMSLSCA
jgi:hypothetical protein